MKTREELLGTTGWSRTNLPEGWKVTEGRANIERDLFIYDGDVTRATTEGQNSDFCDFASTFYITPDVAATPMSGNAVEHPDHYGGEDNPYECIKVIEAWGLNYHLGSVLKYLNRAGKKDPSKKEEDLRKALWYLKRELEKDTH